MPTNFQSTRLYIFIYILASLISLSVLRRDSNDAVGSTQERRIGDHTALQVHAIDVVPYIMMDDGTSLNATMPSSSMWRYHRLVGDADVSTAARQIPFHRQPCTNMHVLSIALHYTIEDKDLAGPPTVPLGT